jgi:hypothetical protein
MNRLKFMIIVNSLFCLGAFGQCLCNSDYYIDKKDSICSILRSKMIDVNNVEVLSDLENAPHSAVDGGFETSGIDTVALIVMNSKNEVIEICFNRIFPKGKYIYFISDSLKKIICMGTDNKIITILTKNENFNVNKSLILH